MTTATIPQWRVAGAEKEEAEAEEINTLLLKIEQGLGMFAEKSEVRQALELAHRLLLLEEDNRRSRAATIREGGGG